MTVSYAVCRIQSPYCTFKLLALFLLFEGEMGSSDNSDTHKSVASDTVPNK